ncbi:hypothetical protein [Methylophaga sp.]|uniref:hypothetical protein n=1 Tax=Methylophaga sp. TaxID=2024840 RepID=UPI003A926D67
MEITSFVIHDGDYAPQNKASIEKLINNAGLFEIVNAIDWTEDNNYAYLGIREIGLVDAVEPCTVEIYHRVGDDVDILARLFFPPEEYELFIDPNSGVVETIYFECQTG